MKHTILQPVLHAVAEKIVLKDVEICATDEYPLSITQETTWNNFDFNMSAIEILYNYFQQTRLTIFKITR